MTKKNLYKKFEKFILSNKFSQSKFEMKNSMRFTIFTLLTLPYFTSVVVTWGQHDNLPSVAVLGLRRSFPPA